MLLSEGQMSDYKGAALVLDALPPAKALLSDRGYDADWFRKALAERNITACMHLHFIAKNIERVGDHATTIAEQVIYLATGDLPRDPRPKSESVTMGNV